MAEGPFTRDRHPGIRDEEAISIEQVIDEPFEILTGATMVVDDPDIELTGSIEIPITSNLLIF